MEVLLAKDTLILGSDSQTITPPAQLQQPVQQQLPKPVPTKLLQRGGAAGGAQGSAHKMFTLAASLGNVPACQNASPLEFTGDWFLMLHSMGNLYL